MDNNGWTDIKNIFKPLSSTRKIDDEERSKIYSDFRNYIAPYNECYTGVELAARNTCWHWGIANETLYEIIEEYDPEFFEVWLESRIRFERIELLNEFYDDKSVRRYKYEERSKSNIESTRVTKVDAFFRSVFFFDEKDYNFEFNTRCVYFKNGTPTISEQTINLTFGNQCLMRPSDNYGKHCMKILEKYDDKTILEEEKDEIREMYFIGKLIDKIAYDVIVQTSLIRYYSSSDTGKNDKR